MATPVFSNKPRFCNKAMTTEEVLSLPKFNAMIEGDPAMTSANALGAACGDPNLGTAFAKNVVHKAIRCAGRPIDLNWMADMFPGDRQMINTKEFYNRYMCDVNTNIYAASSAKGATKGGATYFQVLSSNHGTDGINTVGATGFGLWDKDNMVEYTITDKDVATPFANRLELTPVDANTFVDIKPNTPYLVIPARRIGGNSCKVVANSVGGIGYAQKVAFLRVRRDWEVEFDLLRGNINTAQFGITFDSLGNPVDAIDVMQAQEARYGVRMALAMALFMGTPTTNTALISGVGATIDPYYTGFYGLMPSIKYGNGNIIDFRASTGFDLEADGEPLFLYQDSQKLSSRFMVWHGMAFSFGLDKRSTNLVERTGAHLEFETFQRYGQMNAEGETGLRKLGIRSYEYKGFGLDFKKIDAWSDVRYFGSDKWSNTGIMVPEDGPTENGRRMSPMEIYEHGQNGITAGYFENVVDNRYQTEACETLQGTVIDGLAAAFHCMDKWAILNPVIDA